MEVLVERMRRSIQEDADEFWKLDLSFHLSMGIAAKNDVLNNILKGVREQMMDLISKSLLLKRRDGAGCHSARQGSGGDPAVTIPPKHARRCETTCNRSSAATKFSSNNT